MRACFNNLYRPNGTSVYATKCECGGITGTMGTAKGVAKWRAHNNSDRHLKWMAKEYNW